MVEEEEMLLMGTRDRALPFTPTSLEHIIQFPDSWRGEWACIYIMLRPHYFNSLEAQPRVWAAAIAVCVSVLLQGSSILMVDELSGKRSIVLFSWSTGALQRRAHAANIFPTALFNSQ